MDFGLERHVGLRLGLEHDVGLEGLHKFIFCIIVNVIFLGVELGV